MDARRAVQNGCSKRLKICSAKSTCSRWTYRPTPNTAELRAELEAAGKPIGGNDLLIAAHAYATGATIVTANTDEFKRIRGLKVENWLA